MIYFGINAVYFRSIIFDPNAFVDVSKQSRVLITFSIRKEWHTLCVIKDYVFGAEEYFKVIGCEKELVNNFSS